MARAFRSVVYRQHRAGATSTAIRQTPEPTLKLPGERTLKGVKAPLRVTDEQPMLDAAPPAAAVRIPHGPKKLAVGIGFCVFSLVACVLLARHLTTASWPLEDAHVAFVVASGLAYLAAFGFRALGWRHVFPRADRPDAARCLAACGAASASTVVLPFRLDYFVKIATVRRLSGAPLGIDTIVLSIVVLGIVDAVALLPLSVSAFAASGATFRIPLAIVVLFGTGCLAVLVAGPRLARLPFVGRSRRASALVARVGATSNITRSTVTAAVWLFGGWIARIVGGGCLLVALGADFSPMFVLVVLCMAGMMSVLPITAGGGVATVGASAAVLLALGVSKDVAINFSLASGMLGTVAALAAALVGGGLSVSVAFAARRRQARLLVPRV
jgi:uncharacterized membrane protein YbhN (UPF0104 family)